MNFMKILHDVTNIFVNNTVELRYVGSNIIFLNDLEKDV